MEKFYSNYLKSMVQRISRTRARKLYENGETIFLKSSKMVFDNVWQYPVSCNKKDFSSYSNFDKICNYYEYYYCDAERGKFIHFYVKC